MNEPNSKNFGYYFKESMSQAGIPVELIPTSVFAGSGSAAAAVVSWAEAAKMIGSRATLAELIAAVTAAGGPGAGSASLLAVGAAKAAGGVLAAYWLGAAVGAIIYATQMMTLGDSWMDGFVSTDIRVLLNQAERYGIELPQHASGAIAMAQMSHRATA